MPPAPCNPAGGGPPPHPRPRPGRGPAPGARPAASPTRKEWRIGDATARAGKIEVGASVRSSDGFKGDVNVHGDLTFEAGAKLTGGVRADKVTIAGDLEGNVQEASRVDLLATGAVIGDLKAGSVTVAAGARMRGKAEFGWDEGEGSKAGKHHYSAETGAPL